MYGFFKRDECMRDAIFPDVSKFQSTDWSAGAVYVHLRHRFGKPHCIFVRELGICPVGYLFAILSKTRKKTRPSFPVTTKVDVSLFYVMSTLPPGISFVRDAILKRHLYSAVKASLSSIGMYLGSTMSAILHISCRTLLYTPSAPTTMSPSYMDPSVVTT
jgi:hypothetical protein